MDTIVAPVTPPGKGGVSIVRISGQQTRAAVERFVERSEEVLSQPRRLVFSKIRDREVDSELDQALCVYFSGAESFTGEHSAEFHLHGSPFLVKRLLDNLTHIEGVRLAEPGEFSKRAFLNGKLDLSQAEAIADLINAETASQARLAREQLNGKLSQAVQELGEPLRDVLAEIEAFIDFPEEDIELKSIEAWTKVIQRVRARIGLFLESFQSGRLQREGLDVAIVGLPNAGKSSLLNQLVGEDRAIVSAIAGTTRDTIEEHISLDGQLIKLWDTAGITPSSDMGHVPDELEKLGVDRSWKRLERADVAVFLLDGGVGFHAQEKLLNQILEEVPQVILVCNKLDLLDVEQIDQWRSFLQERYQRETVFVSALERISIGELQERLRNYAAGNSDVEKSSVLVSSKRHFDALRDAETTLLGVIQGLQDRLPPELLSIDIRRALSSLEEIVGVTHTEDILGRIFSRFCIGK